MIPYCGTPPVPTEVWSRWNFDPVLIGVFCVILALYWARIRTAERVAPGRPTSFFLAGGAVLAFVLISPLCALSVALFAARSTQHLIIIAVAAPLLALGLKPLMQIARWKQGRAFGAAPAALFFTFILWFWHAPGAYVATFANDTVYWTMHASMLASAIWLWLALLDDAPDRMLEVLGAGFLATMQMAVLGALLTFSVAPVYPVHFETSAAFGLSPLDDQRLGGLIMWIPGCAALLAATLAPLARVLQSPATLR